MLLGVPWLLIGIVVAIAFAAWLYAAVPRLVEESAGRILLFVALLAMPALFLVLGSGHAVKESTKTEFCGSCHEMTEYVHSLYIDDEEFMPAVHFQNNLVEQDEACYACHTDYTMYGTLEAKLTGLGHVWVHYMGDIPERGSFELYSPYPNQNCLKCHQGTRRFEAQKQHESEDATLEQLYAGEVSCQSKGCHGLNHGMKEWKDLDFWRDAPHAPAGLPAAPPETDEDEEDDLWGDEDEDEDDSDGDAAEAAPDEEAPKEEAPMEEAGAQGGDE